MDDADKKAIEKFQRIATGAPIAANTFLTLHEEIEKVSSVLGIMGPDDLAGYVFNAVNPKHPTEFEVGAMKGWLLLAVLEFIKSVNADGTDSVKDISSYALEAAERVAVDALKSHRLDNRVEPGWWREFFTAFANLPARPEEETE